MEPSIVRPARRGRPARVKPVASIEPTPGAFGDVAVNTVPSMPPEPVEAVPERPVMRPAMREEDPRARAARRAAELRQHLGDMDEGTDEFYIDPDTIPEGWSYEWKRKTVMGAEDPAYTVAVARRGWEAVPAYRHPEMMPKGMTAATIERKGMVLMERPKDITDEVRTNDQRAARRAIQAKEEQLFQAPNGQFDRDHPQIRPRVKKSFEPVPVPDDK